MDPLISLLRHVRLGAKMFAINAVLQTIATSAEWVEAYGLTTQGPVEQLWPTLAAKLLVFPIVFTAMAMLMLLVTPLKKAVSACFRDPSTIAIAALFTISLALYLFTDLDTLSFVLGWLSLLFASITQLRIEDLGPQPWLGAGSILFSYGTSLFFPIGVIAANQEDATFAVPNSVIGWIGAALNLGLTGFLLTQHIRNERVHPGAG